MERFSRENYSRAGLVPSVGRAAADEEMARERRVLAMAREAEKSILAMASSALKGGSGLRAEEE